MKMNHTMPNGMDAEVPCRPAYDVDTPASIQRLIRLGVSRECLIIAILNNDTMSRHDAIGRYETEYANVRKRHIK